MKLKIKDSFKKDATDYFSDSPDNHIFILKDSVFLREMFEKGMLDIIIDSEVDKFENDLIYSFHKNGYYFSSHWLEPVDKYKKRVATYETKD